MRGIALVLLGMMTVLAGCQSGSSTTPAPRNCTPRLQDAGVCTPSYGTTFTVSHF